MTLAHPRSAHGSSRTLIAWLAGSLFGLAVVPDHAGSATPQVEFKDVITPTAFDVSPPLRDLARSAPGLDEGAPSLDAPRPVGALLEPLAARAASPSGGPGPQDRDEALQDRYHVQAMPAPIANFDGPSNLCFCLPPSPSMDVGPSHVVVATNLYFAIYSKTGAPLLGPVANNTLWAGFGGSCQTQNAGQPSVLYDQLADRWLISQLSSNTAPFGLCIAVSTSGDPTGAWYRWSFNTGSNFPEEHKWGLWPNAYFLSTMEFANAMTFAGVGAYAFRRGDLLAGTPSPQVIGFLVLDGVPAYNLGEGLLPADLDGAVEPPSGSPAIFLGTMDDGGYLGAPQDALTVWQFHVNFMAPRASSFTLAATLPTAAFDAVFPCSPGHYDCIPQPGTPRKLDIQPYRHRLLNRVSYRNHGTHASVVANQSVEAAPAMAGIRWYEVRGVHGTPTIHQQGTYAPGASDGIHRWMGGIAMDRSGNMALGYSVSNASIFPGIRYTGRLATDPLGTMPQGEGVIVNGGGSQTFNPGRWGNHSSMNVDPVDDCTFWYVNEYLTSTSTMGWRTRVASFRFPTCSPLGVGDEPPAARTALVVLGPSRGSSALVVSLAGAGPRRVELDVLDVSGRRVRRLLDAELGPGRHDVTWDAADDRGARVQAGVYFARLRAGEVTDSAPIFLLR